jgi:alpha-L-arabinofuranosidase
MHDLVEFCRGDESTLWGKVRISLGHEEPFELKYICIGNEQEGEVYFERYEIFLKEFNKNKELYPELYKGLELIYSSGADDATSGANYYASYEYAKDYINKNGITADEFAGATDHHYYNEPDWFFKNTDHYDEENYSRDVEGMTDTHYGGGIKVFVGEYAARSNRLEAALAEAAYMTGLERNGDIVVMAAYAPLFGNLTATHWAPDLIWFNNHLSTGSINYYMQKLFSNNGGDTLVKTDFSGAEIAPEKLQGKVGLGTWWTQAEFDNVKVVNNENGRVLRQDKFSLPTNFWWNWQEITDGDWKIKGGKLQQKNDWHAYNPLGAISVFGDETWSDYTYTFEATKTKGGEGFLIPFLYEDENNMFFWNIGGWGNTKTALQRVENGVKSEALFETMTNFTVEEGRTYEIKLVVSDYNIKGYIDGELQFDYDPQVNTNAECYQVVSTDEETGDIIIKLVNRTGSDRVVAVDLGGTQVADEAYVAQVAGNSLNNDNILGAKEDCIMEEFTVKGFDSKFNYTVPQYSATVIRLHTK